MQLFYKVKPFLVEKIFFKIFKRLTGMTPKAYSKSMGEPTEKA